MSNIEDLFVAIIENIVMIFLTVMLVSVPEPLSGRILIIIFTVVECYHAMELRKELHRYIRWRIRLKNKRGK